MTIKKDPPRITFLYAVSTLGAFDWAVLNLQTKQVHSKHSSEDEAMAELARLNWPDPEPEEPPAATQLKMEF